MANQGAMAHEDTIQPSLRCVAISASKFPRLLDVSLFSTFTPSYIYLALLNRVIGSHQTLPSLAMSDSEKVPHFGTVFLSEETLHLLRSARIQLSRTASELQATLSRLATR